MPANPQQMMQLIDRLCELTARKELRWNESPESNKYHVRVGDHSIQLHGPRSGALQVGPEIVVLTVLRLDGTVVDQVNSTITIGMFSIAGVTQIDEVHAKRLVKLYNSLTDTSTEIEDILQALNGAAQGKIGGVTS